MTIPFDVRNFSTEQRLRLAEQAKNIPGPPLPHLDMWNYSPCKVHANGWVEDYWDEETSSDKQRTVYDRPKPGCRKCGIIFRQHQRQGILWLYLRKRGLLADPMGPQPLSAPVLTPNGWKPMGALSVGDALVNPDGGDSVVVAVHDRGVRPVYAVTFSDGSVVEASDNHLWVVNTPDRKHRGAAPKVLSTAEILLRGTHYSNGNRKWYIPMTAPVEFVSEVLPLDPYFLGAWLGDGAAHSISTDKSLAESLVLPDGVSLSAGRERGTADYHDDFGISGLTPYLNMLGLQGARSWEKFIPQQYLRGSAADRVALLQGLLDTDGTPMESRGVPSSGVEYGSTSLALAEGVKELVESLGGTASIEAKSATYTYRGEKLDGRTFYRMYLRLPVDVVPFRLDRKLARWTPRTKYAPTRAIESIVYLREEEVRCIEVSAPSHTYLTNSYVVTHNTGKTSHAAGLIALLMQTGEIPEMGRVIVVPRASAIGQWKNELLRMMPKLNLAVPAEMGKDARAELYAQPWDVLLISPKTLYNDREWLEQFQYAAVITDDVDALRNWQTDTSYVLKKFGRKADRMVVMTGTPLQKKLRELWSTLEPLGGLEAFGPLDAFERRHITTTVVREKDERTGLLTKERTVPAYRNMQEVKDKIAPMVLRRRIEDLEDVNLPEVNVSDVYLDLYPAQKNKYDELRRGVLQIIKEQGTEVKHITALSQITYGAQICGGLAALGEADGPNTSSKMDWIMDKLLGELEDEKVVLFANYKNSVRALQDRFRENGIGFETVWGESKGAAARMASQDRFWDDPSCRVLIGTQAIEQSLNLQVARHLINMDTILNPSRMAQLAGRIRREGSVHKHVFVHNLLTNNTQEIRYMSLLEREAALSDFVWDESNELFEALDPMTLLRLITG